MADLPSGTVTFLFTDIEGSTRLWDESPGAMGAMLRRHDSMLAARIEEHAGYMFASTGDGVAVAFGRVEHALAAAVAIQRDMAPGSDVELRIRMAIHTGEAEERSGNYFGPVVNETARLLGCGHGGQILVSGISREILGNRTPDGLGLDDLGEHRFRDVGRPLRVFQVTGPGIARDFAPLRGIEPGRSVLPVVLTRLIGREQELGDVGKEIRGHRLVTLIGAGGCGKTRLAIEAALQHEADTFDPVWFVELAPVSEPELVVPTLGRVMGATSGQGRDDLEPVVSILRTRSGLVVLDNCEHLIAEVARVVAALLRESSAVRILATSREPLGLQGEVVRQVAPLRVPPEHAAATDLLAFDAVRLFEERAAESRPGFAITASNAVAVARICRRLDGIPLGLELAAARLRVLPVEEIARRLEDSLAVLGTAGRDIVPHHRTLEATLDWSFDLLTPTERELLAHLAVFAGGWTLEAMEAVWSGDTASADSLDLLASLVEKSLVSLSDDEGRTRYRLLEPIRQYAGHKLAGGGAEATARERHARYYAQVVERAFPGMWGPEEADLLDALELDVDNVREALTWHVENGVHSEAQAMAGGLVPFWSRTHRANEAIIWQQRTLALSDRPSSSRARALVLSTLHHLEDAEKHHRMLDEAVALYREFGPRWELALALVLASDHAESTGDWQTALGLSEEALRLATDIGNESMVALATAGMGSLLAHWTSDLDRAGSLAEQAVQAARRSGSQQVLYFALNGAADLEEARGALDAAEALLIDAYAIEHQARRTGATGLALARLAEIAMAQNHLDRALSHLREQHRQIESLDYGDMRARGQAQRDQLRVRGEVEVRRGNLARGVTLLSAYLALRGVTRVEEARQQRVDGALASARTALGEEAYSAAWEHGQRLNLLDAARFGWE
ncbi:MAG: hypothetical protein HZA58_08595 [Acidimicrobiia bacterium]|nr:hypothetical protein [Acidimicrobiia bacterium]